MEIGVGDDLVYGLVYGVAAVREENPFPDNSFIFRHRLRNPRAGALDLGQGAARGSSLMSGAIDTKIGCRTCLEWESFF